MFREREIERELYIVMYTYDMLMVNIMMLLLLMMMIKTMMTMLLTVVFRHVATAQAVAKINKRDEACSTSHVACLTFARFD